MKQRNKAFFITFILILVGGWAFSLRPTEAGDREENAFFDKRKAYDIYYDSGDVYSYVIKNVKINRFENIGGKIFIVIESYGFTLGESEGYILFDSVSAVDDVILKCEFQFPPQ